ncbi:MAG: hypothetical protein GXP55_03965 [Deltaproteobacteria bacterium]|nr:hypothetical protein [Deltaproteobacteria bacterium]
MTAFVSACGGPNPQDWARVCGRYCAGHPVQVEIDRLETCVRYAGGAMICWGDVHGSSRDEEPSPSHLDSFGFYSSDPHRAARLVPGMLDVRDMACSAAACCSLRSDDSVWCWGWKDGVTPSGSRLLAKPGIADPRATAAVPEPVPGLERAERFIPDSHGMTVLTQEGRVYRIEPGALRDITNEALGTPTRFTEDCELNHGHVYCRGYNGVGQRGLGHLGNYPGDTPDSPVVIIDDAIALAANGPSKCAARENGEVWCWGLSGILDHQEPDYDPYRDRIYSIPRRVGGLEHIVDLRAGSGYNCALRDDHQLVCWGFSRFFDTGHCGGSRWEPYAIPGADDVLSFSTDISGICILHESGEVACNGGLPPEVGFPQECGGGQLVTIPNLPDLPTDFADEPTLVPEEPFDFDASGRPPPEPNIVTFP